MFLFFDQTADRAGHQVKRFAQDAELVAPVDAHAVRQIPGLHILRRVVQIAHGFGDAPGENDAGQERADFKQKKDNGNDGEEKNIDAP